MKKVLLSLAVFSAAASAAFGQITVPTFPFANVPGGTVAPLVQGSAGTYTVQGTLLPQVEGSLSSVTIDAILNASVNDTYANDLAIIVTSSEDLSVQANYILQIGGYSTFVPGNKFDWPCGAACDSDEAGTPVTGTVSAFTALDFTNSTYIIWVANGYVDANPPTNSGSWTVNSIVFGGLSMSNTASVHAITELEVVTYPNPAENVLNFATNGVEVELINIYSNDGRLVLTGAGNSIDVSTLNSGMYFYELVGNNGSVTKKSFVKK